MTSKGLEALHHPRIKLASIDISAEGKHDMAYMPFYKTKQYAVIEKELKELEERREMMKRFNEACVPMILDNKTEKKLNALEILSEHIIINEKGGYVEFQCDFSLPTNSKYENEEHFKEKINLLKEVLL